MKNKEQPQADAVLLSRQGEEESLSFPPFPCLNVAAVLKRLDGNQKLYLKLVRDFIDGNGKTLELLLQELRAERWEEATLRVHSIKGIAGSIGSKELEAAAYDLEKDCWAAQNGVSFPLEPALPVFIDCYNDLTTAIGDILARQSVVPLVKPAGLPGNKAELGSLLALLKHALTNDEPRPCKEILAELRQKKWTSEQEALIAELNRLINRYCFADALALIDGSTGSP